MTNHLNVYTEPYTEYVIDSLINIKGKSKSDVANFMIKEWIADHNGELKEYDITVKDARKKGVL